MLEILVHLVLGTIVILIVARVVPGIDVANWRRATLGAVVLGAVNALIRPAFMFITGPINYLTLGLSVFIVNALMLKLAAAAVPGFSIKGCLPALLGALLMSALNLVIARLLWQ